MTSKVPKCAIHKKELVCPSCAAAAAGSLGGQASSEAKVAASRENIRKALETRLAMFAKRPKKPAPVKKAKKKDPTVWGLEDTMAYLQAHSGETIVAAMAVKKIPKRQQESAKIYLGQHLVKLSNRAVCVRQGPGAYRYVGAPVAENIPSE